MTKLLELWAPIYSCKFPRTKSILTCQEAPPLQLLRQFFGPKMLKQGQKIQKIGFKAYKTFLSLFLFEILHQTPLSYFLADKKKTIWLAPLFRLLQHNRKTLKIMFLQFSKKLNKFLKYTQNHQNHHRNLFPWTMIIWFQSPIGLGYWKV